MKALQALACGLIAGACSGTETGNPVHDRQQAVRLAYAPLTTRLELGDRTPITIDGLDLQLSSIELERCDDGASFPIVRARELDLLAAEADLGRVPQARYCALQIALGDGADRFSAARAEADGSISVAFSSGVQVDARVRLREPIEIADQPVHWIVGFDLQRWVGPLEGWLAGVDEAFEASSDNAALTAAIASSIALYDDLDRDTVADPEELAAPLSEAESSEAQVFPGAQ